MKWLLSRLLVMALLGADVSLAQGWRWSNPTPNGNNIVDMAYNGSLSVMVAELGQLYTGTDFLAWLPQNSGTTNDLQAVKFFGNRIVYVGANGTAGYSDDGVNFRASTLSTPDPGDWLVDLAVSSNLVVAVGDNAIIYTSPNGAGWNYQGRAPANGGNWLLSAAWGAGTFVITGEGGYVATSVNGTNWTSRVSGGSTNIGRVVWIQSTNSANIFPYSGFWAVTDGGQALYSTNAGVTWYPFKHGLTNAFLSTNSLYAVAANNTSGLVAGASDLQLGLTTNSLVLWPSQVGSLPYTAPVWTYYSAMWDSSNGVYRVAGENGMIVEGIPLATNLAYSWPIQYDAVRDWLWQAGLAGDLYVAVGDHARIMTSANGGTWSIEAIPTNSFGVTATNTVFLCVGGTTNLFLAAGTSGSLVVSPNTQVTVTNTDGSTNVVGAVGVIWYPMPAPTTNDLAATCTFNNYYYLAGGNATLLRSPDGTNWATISAAAAGSTDLSGLAASGATIVATGDQGLILSSPDGVTWTKRGAGLTTNAVFRVRYVNTNFLAFGENGVLLKSTDGVTWSAVSSGTTNWLNDAVMVSNTCYVVGNGGTVLASTNLVNWINMPTVTALPLCGAATQNGQLIAVGSQGTILRNQVVPNLTSPIFFYGYSQSGGQNVFYLSGYPDQMFTLDSSTNLLSWTTGPLLDFVYPSGTLTVVTQVGTNPPASQFYRATAVP